MKWHPKKLYIAQLPDHVVREEWLRYILDESDLVSRGIVREVRIIPHTSKWGSATRILIGWGNGEFAPSPSLGSAQFALAKRYYRSSRYTTIEIRPGSEHVIHSVPDSASANRELWDRIVEEMVSIGKLEPASSPHLERVKKTEYQYASPVEKHIIDVCTEHLEAGCELPNDREMAEIFQERGIEGQRGHPTRETINRCRNRLRRHTLWQV